MNRRRMLPSLMLLLALLSGCDTGPLPFVDLGSSAASDDPRIDDRDEALRVSHEMLLTRKDLGREWTAGQYPEEDLFAQETCGVHNEPNPPEGFASSHWVSGASQGSYAYNTIRPVGDRQAREVVDKLRDALKNCTESAGTKIQPIPVPQQRAVAWSATDDEGTAIWAYLAHGGALCAVFLQGDRATPEYLAETLAAQETH